MPNTVEVAENYLRNAVTLVDWVEKMRKEIPEANLREISEYFYFWASQLERLESKDCDFEDIGVRASDLPSSLASIRSTIMIIFQSYLLSWTFKGRPSLYLFFTTIPEVTHVGLKGEFTASVLDRFKNNVIDYPLPPEPNQTSIKMGMHH